MFPAKPLPPPVGPAGEAYAALERTAEYRLCHLIEQYGLAFMNLNHIKAAGGGISVRLLTHLRDMTMKATATEGDPGAIVMLDRVREQFSRTLDAWMALQPLPDGDLPISDELLADLTVEGIEPWFPDGAENEALEARREPLFNETLKEHDLVRRERRRTGVRPGIEATITDIGGEPEKTIAVLEELAPGRLALADGRVAEWQERTYSSGHVSAFWRIVEGPDLHATLRPAQPLDSEIAAMLRGRWTADAGILPILPPRKRAREINREFRAAIAAPDCRLTSALGGTMHLDRIVREVLPKAGYGPLLAYLNRRFGPPPRGSDPHKSLCGAWLLTTPHPELFIMVEPSVSGPEYAFYYALTRDADRRLRRAEEAWSDEIHCWKPAGDGARRYLEIAGPFHRAARHALLDLLRPVRVRDLWIDAQGRVKDSDVRLAYDEEAERHDLAAEPAASSNYGIPREIFSDPQAFFRLMETVKSLDADPAAAMRIAAEVLKKPAEVGASPT
mgnify:FL=1